MKFESNILFLPELSAKLIAFAYFTRINILAKLLPVDSYAKIEESIGNRQLVWGSYDKRTFSAHLPSLYTDLSLFISCLFVSSNDTSRPIRDEQTR
jgi:hypothetical protein